MKNINLEVFAQAPGALNYHGRKFHIVPVYMSPIVEGDTGEFVILFDVIDSENNIRFASVTTLTGEWVVDSSYLETSGNGNDWWGHASILSENQDTALLEFLKLACLEPMADIADAVIAA